LARPDRSKKLRFGHLHHRRADGSRDGAGAGIQTVPREPQSGLPCLLFEGRQRGRFLLGGQCRHLRGRVLGNRQRGGRQAGAGRHLHLGRRLRHFRVQRHTDGQGRYLQSLTGLSARSRHEQRGRDLQGPRMGLPGTVRGVRRSHRGIRPPVHTNATNPRNG